MAGYLPAFSPVVEPSLRKWQGEALGLYEESGLPRDFLVTATPGAGKTTFALTLASRLLKAGKVVRVIIVAPTDHLRAQWVDNAKRFGIQLDGKLSNQMRRPGKSFCGYVCTYAQVALAPLLHMSRTQEVTTLVILDEVHHAGDGLSWGDAVYEAFMPAKQRLCLTGTPFRTVAEQTIPFVQYEPQGDGSQVSVADYGYGYKEALRDGVVRPVMFAAYSGLSSWRNSAGEVVTASLAGQTTKRVEMAAWKTALNPAGKWIPHVFAAADDRLEQVRRGGVPDAAGLVLAADQDMARAYVKVLHKLTGVKPVLVLSDDSSSSKKIERFTKSGDRWVVAVRQISEGVDVPRISVIVWATAYRTPLFFAQAVGRAIRSRAKHESATVFLPAVRPLLMLAAEMEEERNHVVPPPKSGDAHDLGLLDEVDDVVEDEVAGESENAVTALDAHAEFAHLLFGGEAHVGAGEAHGSAGNPAGAVNALSEDEVEFLGLPGLLDAQAMSTLLKKRDAELREKFKAGGAVAEDVTPAQLQSEHQRSLKLRKEINGLVSKAASKQKKTHAQIHSIVRNAVPGPPSKSASVDVLESRRDYLFRMV